jgi:signal transduction histidine kinase
MRAALALGAASVPLGVYGEWAFSRTGADIPMLLYDLAAGWAFVAAGLVASLRQPANRSGLLLVTEGFTWFLTNLEGSSVGALVFLGGLLVVLNEAVLAHLILAFPSGRLTSNLERGLALAGYTIALVGGFAHAVTRAVPFDPYRCRDCTAGIVLLPRNQALLNGVERGCEALGTLLAVALAVLIIRRWLGSTVIRRRVLSPLWLSLGSCVLLLGSYIAAALQYQPSADLGHAWVWASDLLPVAVPAGFLVAALRMRMARSAVGEVVLGLGPDLSVVSLQAALVRALGDPSIRVGLWHQGSSTYRDAADQDIRLPGDDDWRTASLIELDDRPVAVVVHDRSLAVEGRLMQTVAAAIRMGAEREQLVGRLRGQLEEVRASRARIADAADAERRRLERDLHDGAQQRLVLLSMTLRSAQRALSKGIDAPDMEAALAEASEELNQGLSELRDLARGIHPAVLTERGLAGAVESLAARMPIPVETAIAAGRCSAGAETSAYFVVCEALTNVAKHARASRARVDVSFNPLPPGGGSIGPRLLVVEVADDGVGGADAGAGSGLRGLVDRVAAAGGTLSVESPVGAGTRIRAELPSD